MKFNMKKKANPSALVISIIENFTTCFDKVSSIIYIN